MRHFFALLFCHLLVVSLWASDDLQPIPPLTGPVIDLTNTLSVGEQQQLSQKLTSLHQKYGAQMQVLIIPSSAPEDAFSYSLRVVEKWQLGTAGKDDGLLLFIAKNDRRSQIQVGYGLEGTLPDAIASRLLNEVMAPYFKQGNFYGGINAVVDGVFARISGDASLAPQVPASSSGGVAGEYVLFFAFLVFVILHILKKLLGRPLAAMVGVPLGILAGWLVVGIPILAALMMMIILSVVVLAPAIGGTSGYHRGGWGGGYSGGGGFGGGGGGWSGGGGGFGGGGAGGRW